MTELELAELDLAVAKAEGIEAHLGNRSCFLGKPPCKGFYATTRYIPTRDPAEAMRLLEKYGIGMARFNTVWRACILDVCDEPGQTPAIAICKAVIALKAAKP